MKTTDFLNESFVEDAGTAQQDHEVQMARADLFHAAEDALALHKMLRHVSESAGLEGWVSAKITLAADYLNTVREYMEYQLMTGAPAEPAAEVIAVAEAPEDNPVVNAITRRIMSQRVDLLAKYGPEYVSQAIDDVADSVGSVDEIGSSDVSGWVRNVEMNLKNSLNQYNEPMSDIDTLAETTTAGSVASVPNPTPKNKAKVGSLFGGTYKQKKSKA